jgi:uncharacterized membrane protein YhaH (DUF805 family)
MRLLRVMPQPSVRFAKQAREASMDKPVTDAATDAATTMPMGGDPTAMLQAMAPYFAVFAIVGIAIFAFMIFIQWKIFSKAGHPGALALLNLLLLIPLINIIGCLVMLIVWIWFAFSDWPALKKTQAA